MTLKECYAAMEGDYEDVLSRLRSERLVQKFLLKFLDDGSYDQLCQTMEVRDYSEAFRAAHTLKGVCQNLSFTKLGASSSDITEALRSGNAEEAGSLIGRVQEDYEKTAEAIRAFKADIDG